MSNTPENFGTTLAGGIQDVSAILPLLGTEQCETQVGSALEKGYLYAASSTLSLFGSLGTAKAGFATLVGSFSRPWFYGGRWLHDAGFGTTGSVTSMVTIDKETGLYGAEVKLKKLLEEQHIEDPNLVSCFEWSGWGRVECRDDAVKAMSDLNDRYWWDGRVSFSQYWGFLIRNIRRRDLRNASLDIKGMCKRLCFLVRHIYRLSVEVLSSWNRLLVLTSALCAIISISPYVYLASRSWSHPLSWIYPALRSFGSFLCAVCIQLALQLRIHHITNTSLEWMKLRHKKGDIIGETRGQTARPLEQCVREHLSNTVPDAEKATETIEGDAQQRLESLVAIDLMLVIYQLLIAMGMVMIVAGYVGCFSLVKNSNATGGPYVWFAMEAVLSLLRMVLWGLNPSWDESIGLMMKLKLHEADDPYYPLITSPYHSTELGFTEKVTPQPFTVFSEAEFFSAATSWIGPIQ